MALAVPIEPEALGVVPVRLVENAPCLPALPSSSSRPPTAQLPQASASPADVGTTPPGRPVARIPGSSAQAL